MNRKTTPTPHPLVVVADDELTTLELVLKTLQQRLPGLRVLATHSVQPSVNILLEAGPAVVISGIGPDRVRGYNFLRRTADVVPTAYRVLITDHPLDRRLMDELGVVAALRRPPDPKTLVDLVGGLSFAEHHNRLQEAAA